MRVLSVKQMYMADQRMIDLGVSGASLMDAAGRACADMVHKTWPEGRVIILCGPGNNGGDGFVAYRYLEQFDRDVHLYLAGEFDQLTGDAEGAAELVLDEIRPISELRNENTGEFTFHHEDIVVDAMFGAGLSRSLDGEISELVRSINTSNVCVLSVDIPTGLSGDSAEITGDAIRSDVTVTFEALKPVHLMEPAASLCGQIKVVDIGITDEVLMEVGEDVFLNRPEEWADEMPWPNRTSHKHQRGRVGVVAGPAGSTGAARLAARAGLRMGAGVVTILGEPSAIPEMAADMQAVMTKPYTDVDELFLLGRNMSSLVVGPAAGVNELTRFKVVTLLQSGLPMVLDADALTVFANDPSYFFSLLHENCVLTPHVGEFERIFPDLLASADNKISAARAAAKRAGCVVVLKGADTVIATPDGRARVNVHGSSFLSTAGSGDVLAGMIAGWMAQGMSAYDSASASVWLHGEASLSGGAGLISEDLMVYFPKILTRFYEEKGPKNALWERKIEFSS